mmetsp:Transcript_3488/g.10911  ORF Transcript_3488/g.10911 Transcript_3488/m.10911 type:complete len:236 (+) Transcript_3488:599-1306(+)
MYTRLRMSFWKHEPPKPTDELRNLRPMRVSRPMAYETSVTSAPVASQMADMALMLEMRCARKALAASLEISADHRLDRMMFSRGTQLAYTSASAAIAALPAGVCRPPMRTRSGFLRSSMAVPSARNSGLDRMSKRMDLSGQLPTSTFSMASAVLTGTVDFSTMILDDLDDCAITRAAPSQYVRSAAEPAPTPRVLVGVLTDTKMMSAFSMAPATSVEKNRLRPRAALTTSSRPGS